jgi:site-specific DNA-methyltransferase (adenine-specific)
MINIVNDDCIEGMSTMIEKSVDCIVTSPPYNIGAKYNTYDDLMGYKQYLIFMRKSAQMMRKVLKEDGSLFLNLGNKCEYVIDHFKSCFNIQNTIIWVKSIAIEDRTYGHFKPINSERYLNNCWEYIYHLTPKGNTSLCRLAIGVPYTDKTNIGRYSDIDKRCRGNTWFIPYETVQSKKNHPASFPYQLAEMCFKLHGVKYIDLALDPFNGIGNSAIAAKNLNLNFIGFDIDKTYCEVARNAISLSK